ncbi:hypothetical protein A2334_00025 [Candidatus Roizmanbacteria bacterium RIFOXYB2_FULL_38_10]|uniref:Uncharacterized protein n=1 Tax=Candidatus Roizmanbacteria bacterium RIFOXYD1_FULL_38_12 TaxID=1802093 RepID=A0A1F7L2L9_9BACT|nr:MAG: hypothetical protein A3K47_06105 [Candidatus Roizmanbacteria bacterium RIFOXYA2_FULL_38_14]OGK64313.1 MAG: hypothetical protein A3K27_06105 [Candidatus Roizmanbacteria bacterium RIFOXYA1_FULL_37_12]OGK66159.1 MAG: hypothetical protein A3K38_06105 [Candidatus Roizmanbacteria bacterium RIFOXYB1_FULL_40_23]OGK67821.1 MAG: hypothetical protein A2334_00025 [Candidatus Roizmanbacteria bacterium RIFOXYB2_FULL_38_10]OGK70565.1 MAG: hypothetical protein A3K21_06120 [Candidatus Roizmanbacteria ba
MAATNPEHHTGAPTENDTLKAEVARQSASQLVDEVKKIGKMAGEVKRAVDASVDAARKAPDTFEGDKQDKDTARGRAHSVQRTVKKILMAARFPDKLKPIPGEDAQREVVTPIASSLLKQLSSRIDPEYDVSEQTAPYLHQIIDKVLSGGIANADDLKIELDKLNNLKLVNPDLYKEVQESFVEVAKDTGVSEKDAKQKFNVEEPPVEQTQPTPDKPADLPPQELTPDQQRELMNKAREMQAREMHGEGRTEFDASWGRYFSDYFSVSDQPLLKAIFDPEEFKSYVETAKEEVARQLGLAKTDDDVGKKVSKDIERGVVELFGKLYTRLDHERASEFFEQIEQQDVMSGILPAKNALKRRLEKLATALHHDGDLGLFKDGEIKSENSDIPFKDKEGKVRLKPRLLIHPYPEAKRASTSDFIHYLDLKIDTYIDTRKYTHDARAIFLHPVDPEKGFYSQLARFAEQMTTVDFDQMFLLPDADIFQSALLLYDKHVDEMFAKNDWRHAPTMFQPKSGSHRNQLEEDVLHRLKQMYGKDVSDARLDAAVTMAVGASRGMFLTEIEKAAFADPHVNEDGSITYASYYNNDTSALNAFNPMHTFLRFQGVRSTDPILFMPVEGDKFQGSVFTDHRTMWKNMMAYKDAFISGRKGAGLKEGEVLFADYLMNIGKVGGPMERKGWRTTYILQPLYYKDKKGITEGEQTSEIFDHVHTWQRFENIGYEIAQDFVTKLKPDFKGAYAGGAGLANERYVDQKKALFSYIFDRYFTDQKDTTTVDAYLKNIRKNAEAEVWRSIKEGKAPAPNDVRAEIESHVTMTFLNRTLSRLVAQRIPSKILRIDRDRMSEAGKSRWRTIAEEMFPEKEVGDKQSEKFDMVIKDLLFAEQLLRSEVSAKMREIKKLPESEHWKFGHISYELTQETARALLAAKGFDQAQIDKVCTLLGKIETHFTHNTNFLDKTLLKFVQAGDTIVKEYKFTFGLEELDMSFIPWRAAGNRMLPRAIGDISVTEKAVAGEIMKLPATLNKIAIDGKHDFSPILEICEKVYGSMEGIIGPDYAHRLVHHIAATTINYFKKDTVARWAHGLFGIGRRNSLAAERAGGSSRVWEWDSTDIDRFCVALESRSVLPNSSRNPSNPKPEYAPIYINRHFFGKPIKLPMEIKMFGRSIPLFRKRKPDFAWTIKNLRDKFGGNWKDIAFDMVNKYIPFVIAWLLLKYIKDALDESEGKKKK